MDFVTAARNFLKDPGGLSKDKNLHIIRSTVSYFLAYATGLENAKSPDIIIDYLHKQGYCINLQQWESDVIVKLSREGVYFASHKTKGMYLVNTPEEAEELVHQMTQRFREYYGVE
jgi:hypothetical protein